MPITEANTQKEAFIAALCLEKDMPIKHETSRDAQPLGHDDPFLDPFNEDEGTSPDGVHAAMHRGPDDEHQGKQLEWLLKAKPRWWKLSSGDYYMQAWMNPSKSGKPTKQALYFAQGKTLEECIDKFLSGEITKDTSHLSNTALQ